MAQTVKLKRSATLNAVPTTSQLELGEMAINTFDGKLYLKKDNGTESIVEIGGNSSSGDVTGPASSTDNAITRFDGTTGKFIQNSTVTLDDTGNIANTNSVQFDTTPTVPTAVGAMYWDDGNKTPSVNIDADVTLQLGQENVALVYNGSGSTITNGSVVAVSGAQGQRPKVVLADADSEALSAPTLGIATEDIANGAEGFITTFGFVRGINTSAFTAGAPVYLAQTAGQFTSTRPTAPAHTVALGWVIKVNASSGEVFVNINNGWELDELHNVLITSPSSGNTLIYDATANVWKNANLTDGTGINITEDAGAITVANDSTVATLSGAQTLTNKRITPRIGTIASAASITPTGDDSDQYNVTALATAATILAPSGTPQDGQKLILRFEDNGTARALTWTTTSGAYRAIGVTLPTTTVITKVIYVGCIYNSADTFWDVIAVAIQE